MTSVKAAYKRVEERCPDCNSVDLVEDHAAGDLICTGCGRVVGERMIDTVCVVQANDTAMLRICCS
jgi:transcription initiation factor TFIIIB Brf1 subunit/transcription initiation factor TFIIB